MTTETAQGIVVFSLFVTIGSATGAAWDSGVKVKPKNKQPAGEIVGAFFGMLGCSAIAEYVSPEAGAGLAVLVASVTFFRYGLPLIESNYGEGKKKK